MINRTIYFSILFLGLVLALFSVAYSQLSSVIGARFTGQFSVSVDGNGSLTSKGTIRVEKPPDATVQAAYLVAAALWECELPNSSILLEGKPIIWDQTFYGADNTENGWADVTSLVAPNINAAPSGISKISVYENNSDEVDGEVLVVIFNNPNLSANNTIILLFGGQAVEGETFRINLAEPLDLSDTEAKVRMGLGISYGAQFKTQKQYSIIEINGKRVTSSAGGCDDGKEKNGALLTVGGIGDSFRNPNKPFGPPLKDHTDDELYDLLPFIKDGDTFISVFTKNPSNDDNIFFAWLETSVPAAIGESVVLIPPVSEEVIGSDYTVTAKLTNNLGKPIAARDVTFEVSGGINKGKTARFNSNKNGLATWSYSSLVAGIDSIQAKFYSTLLGETLSSNIAFRRWRSFAAEPSYLKFDSVSVGFGSDRNLVLTNKESALILDMRLITPKGFAANADSVVIKASESKSLTMTFNPEAESNYKRKLLFFDRKSGLKMGEIPLLGTGYIKPPQITISDTVLNFGQVYLESGRELELDVSNTIDYSILQARMNLNDSTFSVSQDTLVIKGKNRQKILLSFKPSSEGEFKADLLINSNSKQQPDLHVQLMGIGKRRTMLSYWPYSFILGLPLSIIIILAYRKKQKEKKSSTTKPGDDKALA